tara:strand:+ start:775 stop:1242 length:468 start_codon:yes stop_codon:yes gene_type:complete
MITFRNVVGYLDTIAENHLALQSFHSGFLDEVDINKLGAEDYPILYAEPGTATIDQGSLTYSFNIYVLDMLQEDSDDRNDTFSENLQILQDVINEFKQNLYSTSWVANEIVLDIPITAEPFTARFDNVLTGWNATLNIEVNNTNNLCISPITPNS